MSNNIVDLLEHQFETAFTAPNGIQKLRELTCIPTRERGNENRIM